MIGIFTTECEGDMGKTVKAYESSRLVFNVLIRLI